MAATLGQIIRERRADLNLTQEELAERVGPGVRQSEISRLERNRVTLPRRQRLEQLAEALDIPVGVLLARSGWVGAEAIDVQAPEPDEEPVEDAATAGPATARGEAAGDAEDFTIVFEDLDRHAANSSWSQDEAQALRDTVSRTQSMISESRTRIRDSESTMVRGRESARRSQPTDPQ